MTTDTTQHTAPLDSHRVTAHLSNLRHEIDRDCGEPIEVLDLNAATLLLDVSRWLGLSEAQTRKVLGNGAMQHISDLQESRITTK